jgi:hypothetical protein
MIVNHFRGFSGSVTDDPQMKLMWQKNETDGAKKNEAMAIISIIKIIVIFLLHSSMICR